jgi:hypothetical protein
MSLLLISTARTATPLPRRTLVEGGLRNVEPASCGASRRTERIAPTTRSACMRFPITFAGYDINLLSVTNVSCRTNIEGSGNVSSPVLVLRRQPTGRDPRNCSRVRLDLPDTDYAGNPLSGGERRITDEELGAENFGKQEKRNLIFRIGRSVISCRRPSRNLHPLVELCSDGSKWWERPWYP